MRKTSKPHILIYFLIEIFLTPFYFQFILFDIVVLRVLDSQKELKLSPNCVCDFMVMATAYHCHDAKMTELEFRHSHN